MQHRFLRFGALAACISAAPTLSVAADDAPFAAPAPVVYVSDFELDAADVTPDSGPGQRVRRLRGLLPSGPGPLGHDANPQDHATKIVNEMADALTADLKKGGVDARRTAPGQPLPASGWQVRGVFLNVDDGNRLRRAMVGFGAGQNNIQVAVSCDSLASANLPPLYDAVEEADSKRMHGAAIKLNPYVIAAEFVMASGDEKKTIQKTAQQIADAVIATLHAAVQ
ncbi:DUF4410 domain-containing protein [Paraburkholderia rhynchosiae]|uniref:DUF4410 domain-containing protein n=1 Tax=Paraburkholderia rhynchosiae TaxID=487049 RepID=A0A2N7WNJ4_9BURK|nr:DUF4410 domain-containing protein [Paraburkholderia rhynchosiae]PMS31028.1 hypothetical protein C0Z16_12435 [Paraburkholderia rhynchosiae]CAB3703305.1 hypothetical protein LMG27174_03793 [Paraburkholderia rhynchosiae]